MQNKQTMIFSKRLATALAVFLLSASCFAQKATITGKVTEKLSSGDQSIPFATVSIAGTTIGSTTDFDGIYTIEVNDKNDCGSILFEVSLLSFPKFFTPDGDGRNDFWQINGISNNFYQSGTIKIFNRYGNLMHQFTIDDIGWDGTYNGNVLPSNDYWFYIELLDKKNSSRARSGHFSLLRK